MTRYYSEQNEALSRTVDFHLRHRKYHNQVVETEMNLDGEWIHNAFPSSWIVELYIDMMGIG